MVPRLLDDDEPLAHQNPIRVNTAWWTVGGRTSGWQARKNIAALNAKAAVATLCMRVLTQRPPSPFPWWVPGTDGVVGEDRGAVAGHSAEPRVARSRLARSLVGCWRSRELPLTTLIACDHVNWRPAG